MELEQFVSDFAVAMMKADARRPEASSRRSGRVYQPGVGPHAEDAAVDLTISEMRVLFGARYSSLRVRVPYPLSRRKCDLVLGDPCEWAIEVKMARLSGDNGKPDDTSIKDILSPYENDRSAISDCTKLITSGFTGRMALMIYGFEDARRPLDVIIDAFEVLACARVSLGSRQVCRLEKLIHPIFREGRVFAWEDLPVEVPSQKEER